MATDRSMHGWTGDQPAQQFLAGAPGVDAGRYETGFAVRRNWPDGGHDYFRFAATPGECQSVIAGDRNYWRRGPLRPIEWVVVHISVNDFDLHKQRRLCKAPDCPGGTLVETR